MGETVKLLPRSRVPAVEKKQRNKKKTHEEYVEELKIKNTNIEVIGEYVGSDTPIKHHCKKHDIYWDARPQNLLNGQGCMICGRESTVNARRKTHDKYVEEVKSINPNILVIEKYINTHTAILHKCLIDGYEWKTAPACILRGTGCPKCSNNIKKTNEQYVKELESINPNVEVLEKYINCHTHILHLCKIHNIQWKITPIDALKGHGCPKCWREKQGESAAKTNQEYINELNEINSNVEVVDEYKRINIPIKHRCLIDNYEWYTTPQSLLQGSGCPKCNESHGERQISEWLDKHDITYISQKRFDDCIDIKPLPFDFYLPTYNRCIEYDGIQHFEPVECFGGNNSFNLTNKHDNIKNEYCKNNGIYLLRIPYYKNIEEELNNFLFI